ncbi:(2Fe-2S)-binding protein [Ruminococcaceae bacterium OttesenSCG-928-I18]|nr:(2Fe-2S)-binding protein [Ruminococcaceae bacterium OttesenSCG-928-I18]
MGEQYVLKVNGKEYALRTGGGQMLADVLRDELHLIGTKKGCCQGECGACTVILDGKAVNSCMIPVAKAVGADILTIEGLQTEDGLHPLQKAFIEEGAVQCGFCTPGMIMSAKALLDEEANPTSAQIQEALSGNICRCTGYVKIEKAVQKASEELRKEG